MDDNNQHIPPLTEQEIEQVWTNVFSRIRKQEKERRSRKIKRLSIFSVTILLLLFGSILAYNKFLRSDIYSANDKTLTIKLADHSQVTLLKGARLTVEKSFPAETRDVFLEGDAIFHVAKSKSHPFIVHGKGYETKVLGTIFRIIQKDALFNVDLYEGKVQVTRSGKTKEYFVLKPKETFSNLGDQKVALIFPTRKRGLENKASKASVSFRDYDLKQATSVIEKIYGIKIIYPENTGNSKISIIAPEETGDKLLEKIAVQLNLNIKKVNENTFQLEE
ncbi:FecR family protein [Sphingobacterium siyangense]|uniref:FecR family protein n=1 Tax=Sphingobacterium siyangense TaxID=459529 RepID=UPI002FDEBAD4